LSPFLPLVGGGHTRFQPVFAGNVAEAIAKAVDGATRPGAIYELGGPDVYTFRELMEFTLATIERRRLLLPLPFGVAKLQAAIFELVSRLPLRVLSKPLLTRDQVELLRYDNVVSDTARRDGLTLEGWNHTAICCRDRANLSVAVPQSRAVSRPFGVS